VIAVSSIRRCMDSDALAIWRWRRDPSVAAYAPSPAPEVWEDHLAWVAERIGEDYWWVADMSIGPVGAVMVAPGDEHMVSIMVDYRVRGGGVGAALLRHAQVHGPDHLHALIHCDNKASMALFYAAGFRESGSTPRLPWVMHEWEKE
jgi:L-amino acid N-acyltransferase YncA